MGNLIDIISDAGKITDCRYHFRTDTLTDLTIHCRLMGHYKIFCVNGKYGIQV